MKDDGKFDWNRVLRILEEFSSWKFIIKSCIPEWERAEYFAFQTISQWRSKNVVRNMYDKEKFKKWVNKKSNFDGVSATFLESQNSFNEFEMAGFFDETILIRRFLE